jgi:hypothetical protein
MLDDQTGIRAVRRSTDQINAAIYSRVEEISIFDCYMCGDPFIAAYTHTCMSSNEPEFDNNRHKRLLHVSFIYTQKSNLK